MTPAARPRPLPDADQPGLPFELPRVTAAARARAAELLSALAEHFPDARCELNYSSAHELLVATILSAQATDAGVNKATPALFAAFPTPAHYAAASPEQIEPYVKSIGLFRSKAKAIHSAMSDIVARYGGRVPASMDDLLTLRGVARKTAGVVLGNAFDVQAAFVVDTHVHRLAQRLALVPPGTTVAMTERRLMALFPRGDWCTAGHQLIFLGRRACKARPAGGRCSDHPICQRFGTRCELTCSATAQPPAAGPRGKPTASGPRKPGPRTAAKSK